MLDGKKYKEFAFIQLKNRWTVVVLITLITTVVINILSLPNSLSTFGGLSPQEFLDLLKSSPQELSEYLSSVKSNTILEFIVAIIQSLIQYIFTFAALKVFLQMSRSPEPVQFRIFLDGLNDWFRALKVGLWKALWVFIWGLISIPVLVIAAVVVVYTKGNDSFSILLMVFMIIGLLPAIIRSISYSQMFYIAAENPDMPVRKCMKLSILITDKYLWDIVCIVFSFFGWFLLSALTLGILNLWVLPYYRMTMTNVYHALVKNALEKGIITPEEFTSYEE